MLPAAHITLWFLGVFIGLWAVSLVARGMRGDRTRGSRRCPACGGDPGGSGLSCKACGFEAGDGKAFRNKRRSWRMAAAGAVLLCVGAASLVAGEWVRRWSTGEEPEISASVWDAAAAAVLLFGVIVLVRGLIGDRSRGRRRCPKCWYDMSGGGLRCPECGHEVRQVRGLYRSRRRRIVMAAGLVMALLAAVVQGVPRVRAGGWRAAVPTMVLIAGLPWLPDELVDKEDPACDEDWTLTGRLDRGRTWKWQERLLHFRSRQLARFENPRAIRRATRFLNSDDRDLLGPIITAVAKGLTSARSRERADAAETDWSRMVNGEGDARPDLSRFAPGLLRIIGDQSESMDVRAEAILLLEYCGAAAEPAVPMLIALMEQPIPPGSRSVPLALWASEVAKSLAPVIPSIKERVFEALDRSPPGRGQWLIRVLWCKEIYGPDVEERLLRLLRTGQGREVDAAAHALFYAGANPAVAIPAILDEIEAGSDKDQLMYRLGPFGDQLLPYFPRLVPKLHDESGSVRIAVAHLLQYLADTESGIEIDRTHAWPSLQALLNDPEEDVRSAAEYAIKAVERRRVIRDRAADEPSGAVRPAGGR